MLLTKKVYRTIFLDTLKKNGLTVYFIKNNYFILIKGNDSSRIVSVELICSTWISAEIQVRHNNNMINGIGRFKFTIPKLEEKISYYIFAFFNTPNREIEFVIVSSKVLRSRFQKLNRIPESSKKAELTLWLMPDRNVYDCTNISEGECYFISKGINDRMADNTESDYTDCLNNWDDMIFSFGG